MPSPIRRRRNAGTVSALSQRAGGDLAVQFPSGQSLTLADGTPYVPAHDTDLTVAYWMCFDSLPGSTTQRLVINLGGGLGAVADTWYTQLSGTTGKITVGYSTGSGYQQIDTLTPSTGVWYLGIFRWTNQGSPRIDADFYTTTGHLSAFGGATAGYINTPGTPIFTLSDNNNPLKGRMDKVGIWNTLLTSPNRDALWNNGIGCSGSQLALSKLNGSLLGFYDLNEETGSEDRADFLGAHNLIANASISAVPPAGLF